MKELMPGKILLYNPETGKHENIDALRGESAYDAAVRLGYTNLSEAEWVREYDTKRDAALSSIEAKGAETLASITTQGTNAINSIKVQGAATLASIP